MSVSINNNPLNVQPSLLNEYYEQIQTDQMSILGNMARNKLSQKKHADMEFTIMSPSDYQTVINYFITGSGIYYSNDQSSYGTFTFSGLPLFSEQPYVQGASLYRPLKVSIREI